jgi:DNA polymerase-3 subunit delta
MLITLIGPDRYLVGQSLKSYLAKFVSPDDPMGDFGLTRLDGARLAPDELQRAVQAMGFFSERRVVVVEGLLSRFGGGKAAADEGDSSGEQEEPATPVRGRAKADPGMTEGFAQVFAAVPEWTVLILVDRGTVNKNSALLKAAGRHGKVEEHIPPKGSALERWVGEHAAGLGVRLTPGARSSLAVALPDLQTLANELEKLSLYVGEGGTIDERVLSEMSFAAKADDIFEMTSAAARRDTKGALLHLQRLLDGGTSPEGILPVLAWQVRTLIQVRDMMDQRISESRMAEKAGVSDFVIRKSLMQARQFTMPQLLEIHHRLTELDHAVKTGRGDAGLSLDALVVEMCRSASGDRIGVGSSRLPLGQ